MTLDTLLLTALKNASRVRKAPALIAILERSTRREIAPILSKLKACGKQTLQGLTQSGIKRTGRYRCKLPICPRCAELEARRQVPRAEALIASATQGSPDRDYLSLVSVNSTHQDGPKFKKELTKALRGFKFTGTLSVSIRGQLHAHLTVVHEDVSRTDFRFHLKSKFTGTRAVNVSEVEQEWALDGVRAFQSYAQAPLKGRDSIRSPEAWTIDGLVDWALMNVAMTGSRKLEGGFNKTEKMKTKTILDSFKRKSSKRDSRKLDSILLTRLRSNSGTVKPVLNVSEQGSSSSSSIGSPTAGNTVEVIDGNRGECKKVVERPVVTGGPPPAPTTGSTHPDSSKSRIDIPKEYYALDLREDSFRIGI